MTLFDFLERHYFDLIALIAVILIIWAGKGKSK